MTDNNKDAETILKAIILRIESKGNRSFHDANMLQELRLVVEKLNEKMSQHKEEEIADKVTNQNNNRYKGILPELTIEQRENQRKAKKILLDMITLDGCLNEDEPEKNTHQMSKILDKKACETGEKSTFKPELSIDSVYAFLLEDRAVVKKEFGGNNADKELLMKNSEQISDLLKTKHWSQEKNNAKLT